MEETDGLLGSGDGLDGQTRCQKAWEYTKQILGCWEPTQYVKVMFVRNTVHRANVINFDSLDGITALALLWNLAGHAVTGNIAQTNEWEQIKVFTDQGGYSSTSVFLVLSGFFLSHVMLMELSNHDGKFWEAYFTFMWRRVLRVWPLLVLGQLIMQCVISVGQGYSMFSACGSGNLWKYLWTQAFFLGNIGQFENFPWYLQWLHSNEVIDVCRDTGGIAWFFALEFQCTFIILPGLMYLVYHRRKFGYFFSIGVFVFLFCLRGYACYKYVMAKVDNEYDIEEDGGTPSLSDAWKTYKVSYIYQWIFFRSSEYMVGVLAYLHCSEEKWDDEFWSGVRVHGFEALFCLVFGLYLYYTYYIWYPHKQGETDDENLGEWGAPFLYSWMQMPLIAMSTGTLIAVMCGPDNPHHVFQIIREGLSNFLFFPLAMMCYCSYLTQEMWLNYYNEGLFEVPDGKGVLGYIFDGGRTFWMYPVYVFLSLCSGLVMALLVEKPFQKLSHVLLGELGTPKKLEESDDEEDDEDDEEDEDDEDDEDDDEDDEEDQKADEGV